MANPDAVAPNPGPVGASARTRDRFSITYAVWMALFLLLFYAGREIAIASAFGLLTGLVVLLAAIVVAIGRCWRSLHCGYPISVSDGDASLSVLVGPFGAYALFWALGSAGIDVRQVRFELTKPHYLEQIAELPAGVPRFKVFKWGEIGGPLVQNGFFYLIYDESDEIALPSEKRSSHWRGRIEPLCHMCSVPEPSKRSSDDPSVIEVRRMAGAFLSGHRMVLRETSASCF